MEPARGKRLAWTQLPDAVRRRVERIAGAAVVASESRTGGFSPGLASRLRFADGGRVFAKVISDDWPVEAEFYRAEARIAAHLPDRLPVPRLRAAFDEDAWVGLVFDDVDGHQPAQAWNDTGLSRVLSALADLANAGTPTPIPLEADHPRLGGWSELAGDPRRLHRLPRVAPWAADHLALLIDLERAGLAAAHGDSLVHFDLYPHNIVLTRQRVYFVDWPHARRGNPLVDLISLLSTVTGADPTALAQAHPLTTDADPRTLDALIAAHAGFCMAGALLPPAPADQPVLDAKHTLARGYLAWLARRQPTSP